MPLSAGSRLGPYEIVSLIGAGGMGEVYLARDSKLNRNVALKVLREAFVHHPDRLARFQREAQVLASLNHPNIAAIYGLEESPSALRDSQGRPEPDRGTVSSGQAPATGSGQAGVQALVMEFVDGPTLSDRIAQGPLALDEALRIAKQIAEALELAHEQNIIHRDLKPANIKVRADGTVKILDFGLAKAMESDHSNADLVNSPTITSPALTRAGVILGTAAYMAPEQARGKPTDKRADIWAFGVVVYEMLSGRPMFAGETVTDVLAAVVSRDLDWNALPAGSPQRVRRLLRRCLERDPKTRLRDIGEARVAIDEMLTTPERDAPSDVGVLAPRVERWRAALWVGASLLVGALAFLAGSLWRQQPPGNHSPVHAQVVFSPDVPLSFGMRPTLALAPDGSQLVVVTQQKGRTQLYRRSLAEESGALIEGTEGGSGPFFSPDGRWIGFFADGQLKKVPPEGGTAVVLADASLAQGGSFAPDGTVVFSPVHGEGLSKVPPSGGDAEVITTVDHAHGEAGHHWPHVLPDGEHVLMTVEVRGKPYSAARIELVSLKTKEQRVLVEGGTDARYVPTGHLVYWQNGDLWAEPFDATTGTTSGARVLAVRGVIAGEPNGFAEYSYSREGTLVFLGGRHPGEERSLELVDRTGVSQTLTTERRAFETPRVSPDGSLLAIGVPAANDSLWVYAFGRRTLTRMTFDDENRRAAWSPDGKRLAFAYHPGGRSHQIVVTPIDSSAAPEVVHDADRPELPEAWPAPGTFLVFTRQDPETSSDIWLLPMAGDRHPPQVLLNTRFDEREARVSFDGRWLAYQSNESGQPEIYLRPFPGPGGKRQISIDGGTEPRWRQDGRELYYRHKSAVMVVDVSPGTQGVASVPRMLLSGPEIEDSLETSTWDATPDGNHFVMIQDHAEPRTSVSLVLGWFDELRQLGRGRQPTN